MLYVCVFQGCTTRAYSVCQARSTKLMNSKIALNEVHHSLVSLHTVRHKLNNVKSLRDTPSSKLSPSSHINVYIHQIIWHPVHVPLFLTSSVMQVVHNLQCFFGNLLQFLFYM